MRENTLKSPLIKNVSPDYCLNEWREHLVLFYREVVICLFVCFMGGKEVKML